MVSNDVEILSDKTLESSSVDGIETPQEIPFSCDLCEYVGKSTVDFKMHKNRKHDKIPQLDGGDFKIRETDCWWEKKFKNPLKVFKMFKDVLMDIDESRLNVVEKSEERDTVTNARKEALGDNFQYYPPWNCSWWSKFLIFKSFNKEQ